jgi:hypothetical protein
MSRTSGTAVKTLAIGILMLPAMVFAGLGGLIAANLFRGGHQDNSLTNYLLLAGSFWFIAAVFALVSYLFIGVLIAERNVVKRVVLIGGLAAPTLVGMVVGVVW